MGRYRPVDVDILEDIVFADLPARKTVASAMDFQDHRGWLPSEA